MADVSSANVYALGIEYDGSAYRGWQRQTHTPSIQALVEQALSQVADHPINVYCAGRTDAGVHATGQVVHFSSDAQRADHAWLLGANSLLPNAIRVTWAQQVSAAFHARFSASARRYHYVIDNQRVRSALLHQRATWCHAPLNIAAMQAAAPCLLGEQDFSSFRSSECQSRTPMRNVQHINITRQREFVLIDIQANAFLHHMVRNIAGCLMAIGTEKQVPDWLNGVLHARDRTQAAATAAADGLYLVGVEYPEQFNLPSAQRPYSIFGYE